MLVVATKNSDKLAVKVSGGYSSGERADRHARNLTEKVLLAVLEGNLGLLQLLSLHLL